MHHITTNPAIFPVNDSISLKMKRSFCALFLGWLPLMLAVAPVFAAVDLTQFEGMPNAVLLEKNVVSGGPPPLPVLERAAQAGFKTVIDLRRPEEGTEAEKSMVEKLGMRYYSVIVTPRTLSRYQADDIAAILNKPDNLPAILHCESGNRSGALWALYLNLHRDVAPDKALEQGIQKGLRGRTLKEITREIMANEAARG